MVKSHVSSQEIDFKQISTAKIWLYLPHFGKVPDFFQLYLDSLGRNSDLLRIIFITDVDLTHFRLPTNFIIVPQTFEEVRWRASRFLRERLNVEVQPQTVLGSAYKLCDFRMTFLELFDDIGASCGIQEGDFVGWGDCDLIYGRLADFITNLVEYDVIGGFHGHFTALRNIDRLRELYRRVPNLSELLTNPSNQLGDEVAFRKPLLEFLEKSRGRMFYMNRYFCDVVPDQFVHLFRNDGVRRAKNFFDAYHPDREIAFVAYDRTGRLTVYYEDGTSRQSIYCHLQKRAMKIHVKSSDGGFVIRENEFVGCSTRDFIEEIAGARCETSRRGVINEGVKMKQIDADVAKYLRGERPFRLELGAGPNSKLGWLGTDLHARTSSSGAPIVALDATKPFMIPDESFDYVYTEHMIEHLSFPDGLNMLGECHRILRPGGVLRIVTPSLGFLLKIISPDRTPLEERYRYWSVTATIADPPAVTNALFLNNFVRAWGHQFIYDNETLRLALQLAGFREIEACEINVSRHPELQSLECEERIPAGFLALESMIIEAVKHEGEGKLAVLGCNLSIGCRADQSSISPWSMGETTQDDASRVVSGHWTGNYNNHTSLEISPWWFVDLGQLADIKQINVYNRRSEPWVMRRLHYFEIQVSNDAIAWRCVFRKEDETPVHSHRLMPYVWMPDEGLRARYVRIQLIGETYLHLEQVEVYGTPAA
ncbi:DUF6625 family protein [Methylobacterium oxalidis]|uniref:DUF6625 family protein n=1 Tax=Methylobacterium oxalidis TaxID=944322 RepID=UPI003315AB61